MTSAERTELETLRERVAILDARDAVEKAVAGLPAELAEKVRERFEGKAPTKEEIGAHVEEVRGIAETIAESRGIRIDFGPRGDGPTSDELEGEEAATVVREAFSVLTGINFKEAN